MNVFASAREPKRSGNVGANFRVLNHASLLSRIRNNSDYAEVLIMPRTVLSESVCAGQRAAAA